MPNFVRVFTAVDKPKNLTSPLYRGRFTRTYKYINITCIGMRYTFFERPRDAGTVTYNRYYICTKTRAGRFEAISHLPAGNL